MWKVENCETVNLGFKDEKLDPIDFGATQRLLRPAPVEDQEDMLVLKALRLWVSRREDVPEMKSRVDIQIIAYHTFLPQSCKFYENQIGWQQLDDVIETVNETIRSGRIRGELLSVESISYEATDEWVVNTECPKQRESNNKQEIALRLFYVANSAQHLPPMEIAIFDFLPDVSCASTCKFSTCALNHTTRSTIRSLFTIVAITYNAQQNVIISSRFVQTLGQKSASYKFLTKRLVKIEFASIPFHLVDKQ